MWSMLTVNILPRHRRASRSRTNRPSGDAHGVPVSDIPADAPVCLHLSWTGTRSVRAVLRLSLVQAERATHRPATCDPRTRLTVFPEPALLSLTMTQNPEHF